jgi:hypothetical protein
LETQQTFFDIFLMQSAREERVDQQHIMDRFAELAKETQLIKIKYTKFAKPTKSIDGRKNQHFKEDNSSKKSPTRADHSGAWVLGGSIAEYRGPK